MLPRRWRFRAEAAQRQNREDLAILRRTSDAWWANHATREVGHLREPHLGDGQAEEIMQRSVGRLRFFLPEPNGGPRLNAHANAVTVRPIEKLDTGVVPQFGIPTPHRPHAVGPRDEKVRHEIAPPEPLALGARTSE